MRRGARRRTARTQSWTGAPWSASAILAMVLSIMLMHFSGVMTVSSPSARTCERAPRGSSCGVCLGGRCSTRADLTGMVTLPRDSTILYAALGISLWISSEWNFLPTICFRPVTVFLMLEVICRGGQAHAAHCSVEPRRRCVSVAIWTHPAQRSLAVLALLVTEAHHAPAGGARTNVLSEACLGTAGAPQEAKGRRVVELTRWSAWTPRWRAHRCHRAAQWRPLPGRTRGVRNAGNQSGVGRAACAAVLWSLFAPAVS